MEIYNCNAAKKRRVHTCNILNTGTDGSSSIVSELRLVLVENSTGVFTSLYLITLSSNTLFCWGRGGVSVILGNSSGALRCLGLGGTVCVGESGNSLGDTMPLVKRLQTQNTIHHTHTSLLSRVPCISTIVTRTDNDTDNTRFYTDNTILTYIPLFTILIFAKYK